MKKKLLMTYPEFMDAVKYYPIPDTADFIKEAEQNYHFAPARHNFAKSDTGVFIYLHPAKKYAFVNQALANIVGTSIDYIKQNGIGKNETHYYAPDEHTFDNEIFADTLNIFKNIAVEDHPKYRMTGNLRVYNKAGEIRNVLRECYFIKSAADGMPLVSFGYVTDITHIKDNRPIMGYSIQNGQRQLFGRNYYPERGKALTPRQIEIIKMIADGLTTKEIAYKIFINEKTVDNHKQNIRQATNSRNVAEVIKYALQQGYVN